MLNESTIPADKCIVVTCSNRKDEGLFYGDLCAPCYRALTTGIMGYSAVGRLALIVASIWGSITEKEPHQENREKDC